jgi:predicted dinucleotide-binding enzyme
MNRNNTVLRLLLALLVSSVCASIATAETIAVIGTGRVGGALGPRFAELGHTVIYGSRTPGAERVQRLVARSGADAAATSPREAAEQAELIMLAVPWAAAEQVIKDLGNLDGKIIMDAVNGIERGADGTLQMAVDTSAGEMIQSWAPGAFVVKTFNNMNFTLMADPAAIDGPVTVALAGNDAAAKAWVGELVTAMGFPTIDVGPIRYAWVLEGMVLLKLVPMFEGRRADRWEYYFRPYPQEP